ncbi:serine hydrolase domain-containing protein [Flavivirga aquimarina]|uniref:Serine hydrolase domain-containing protein n=1 Tax=Flavivirga aquimarina TaxID=2027862 RepID=A0ABT8W9B3_9FLAO|nr:serine hydrolase domain-containing protein [Flavivirga aquimarina]MDO5969652.1 serine hydrolase domain-containing protein [Flavivirga aquimarina]
MKFLIKFILLFIFIFNVTNVGSQDIKNPKYSSAIFKAHRIIDSLQQKQNIPGIDIAISINGEIIWSEGFGYANLEHQVPIISGKTLFRIGSVSKPFTAMAIGKLLDEGKLNLDDVVQTYVPYFPEKKHPITVRQIAGHIAGIRGYKNDEFLSAKRYYSVEEGIQIFKNDALLFKPGKKYMYSSYGFNLLSAIVEGASGIPFLDFMQNNIFSKLNMNNTYADKNENIILNRSAFYQTDSLKIKNATYVDNSYKWAGGGFISTTHDIIKFGNTMVNETLLTKNTTKTLTTSQKLNNGKKTGYGIGWGVIKRGKLKGYGHNGGSVGGVTKLEIFPKEKLVIIALSNSSNVKYENTIETIVNIFLNAQ